MFINLLYSKPHSKRGRLRNSSPNCKRFLSGSNSYNYNTHLKCICVYKTTTLIEKYNLAISTNIFNVLSFKSPSTRRSS